MENWPEIVNMKGNVRDVYRIDESFAGQLLMNPMESIERSLCT